MERERASERGREERGRGGRRMRTRPDQAEGGVGEVVGGSVKGGGAV